MNYTRSQIYKAIMDAADHIERNPGDYRFTACAVGEDCPACMLGWIGRMLGFPAATDVGHVAYSIGHDQGELYRMNKPGEYACGNALHAAAVMRRFAQKHFATDHEPATQSFDEIMDSLKAGVVS